MRGPDGVLKFMGWSWMDADEANWMHEPDVVSLISDALPFGRLWYGEQNAVSNAVCSEIKDLL